MTRNADQAPLGDEAEGS